MTVRLDGTVIRLEGPCRVEDAEALTILLQAGNASTVDFTTCQSLHGAVVQALLAFRPAIAGTPGAPFLRDLLLPILSAGIKSPPILE